MTIEYENKGKLPPMTLELTDKEYANLLIIRRAKETGNYAEAEKLGAKLMYKTTSFTLREDIWLEAKAIAKRKHITISEYCREAVFKQMLEDIHGRNDEGKENTEVHPTESQKRQIDDFLRFHGRL